MEYYWTLFNNGGSVSSGTISNTLSSANCSAVHPWHTAACWDLASLNYITQSGAASASVDNYICAGNGKEPEPDNYLSSPDPHLACSLKLGKRHYFEDLLGAAGPIANASPSSSSSVNKRGRKPYDSPVAEVAAAAPPPRCQVEGCGVALVNAKDYHRRHKVCETHAKAPKVMVLGIHQRFCQQCSRFHGVGEFDDSKRSCRRRLAGHNERRRKSSQLQDAMRPSLPAGRHRHPHFLNRTAGGERALSLLSYNNPSATPWNNNNSLNLPARCSAALRELIEENRAFRQHQHQHQHLHHSLSSNQLRNMEEYYCYSTYKLNLNPPHENGGRHHHVMTALDLNSEVGLLSRIHNAAGKESSREGHGDGDADEACSELWKLPLGY